SPHPRVQGGQQDVDEGGPREEPMEKTQPRTEEPTASTDGPEDREISGSEGEAEEEVQDIADGLRTQAIRAHGCPEEKRQIHAREPEFARPPQQRRQDQRSHEAAREGSPEIHPLRSRSRNAAAA